MALDVPDRELKNNLLPRQVNTVRESRDLAAAGHEYCSQSRWMRGSSSAVQEAPADPNRQAGIN
jgi:hypothetical protein